MAEHAGETQAHRRERQRREVAAHERANDLVAGTAQHDGKAPRGGVAWEDRARMAIARRGAGLPLDETDRQAIDRFPSPRSGVTGATSWTP